MRRERQTDRQRQRQRDRERQTGTERAQTDRQRWRFNRKHTFLMRIESRVPDKGMVAVRTALLKQ